MYIIVSTVCVLFNDNTHRIGWINMGNIVTRVLYIKLHNRNNGITLHPIQNYSQRLANGNI